MRYKVVCDGESAIKIISISALIQTNLKLEPHSASFKVS